MGRVGWWAGSDLLVHAVIDGDVLTLCGQLGEKAQVEVRSNSAIRGGACPDCRSIVTEAAVTLAACHG